MEINKASLNADGTVRIGLVTPLEAKKNKVSELNYDIKSYPEINKDDLLRNPSRYKIDELSLFLLKK